MSAPRDTLKALVAQHALNKSTLSLIKDATLPALAPDAKLNDAQVGSINQAIEVLILSGLTAPQIVPAIREHQQRSGERWRETFWRERLALANTAANEAEQRGDAGPRQRLATVPPIPPQPPSEVGSGPGESDTAIAA